MGGQGAAAGPENDERGGRTGVVRDLLDDDAKRQRMAEAARKLARPEAADQIAAMLLDPSLQGVAA